MTPYTSNIYLSTSAEFLCTIHFKFDLKKTGTTESPQNSTQRMNHNLFAQFWLTYPTYMSTSSVKQNLVGVVLFFVLYIILVASVFGERVLRMLEQIHYSMSVFYIKMGTKWWHFIDFLRNSYIIFYDLVNEILPWLKILHLVRKFCEDSETPWTTIAGWPYLRDL